MTMPQWTCPALSQFPPLPPEQVHVWRVRLDLARDSLHFLRATLSPDELVKAGKFHFDKDREQFIVARGLLRILLGRILAVKPLDLQFSYNTFGKPLLAPDTGKQGIWFNLAHSEAIALYAFARDHRVGVDVERIQLEVDWDKIAERFFAAREIQILRSLPESERGKTFFDCWTRKEAYLKARGDGLSSALNTFEALGAPGEPIVVEASQDGYEGILRWTLQDIPIDEGYSAALAVEGPLPVVKYWQWPHDGAEP